MDVFRTVVRQQSKIVKGDVILITKAPEQPWAMEAMGRFVSLDKLKVPKGGMGIPTEMQAWISYSSLDGAKKYAPGLIKQNSINTAIREDFKSRADLSTDLEDDNSDSDFDEEDSIEDGSIQVPEGMDKESPNLKHAMDLVARLSPLRTTDLDDNDPSMPESITELANYRRSPLQITRQQNTLETILDELVTIDLGVEPPPPTLLNSPEVLELMDKKQSTFANVALLRRNSLDLESESNLDALSRGKQLKSTELPVLARRLFTSGPHPPKSALDASPSYVHEVSRSSDKVAGLSVPNHIAVFSPRKLRSRKPSKDARDSDNEDNFPDSDEEGFSDASVLGLISPMKLPATFTVPSQDDRLIETPTLTQLGLTYNVKYDILICTECQSGISLSSVPNHAYNGAIQMHKWDEKRHIWIWLPGRKHDRPKIMKSQARAHSATTIQGRVLKELEESLQRPVSPLRVGEPSLTARMNWIALARPHPDQIGPISGLHVYKNAFKCTTGSCRSADFPCFGLVPDTIRMHAKTQHPGMKATSAEGYTVQSMTQYPAFTFYFKVTEPKAQLLPLKRQQLSHADIIHQERQHLLGSLEKSRGLDQDLIHEAFGDVGMKKFWALLDRDMITPLYDLNENHSMSYEDKLLRTAVVATFFDITRHIGDAHPALLHLVAKGAFLDKLSGKCKFTIPQDRTLSYYVLTEIQFLRWMIYAFNQAVMNQQGKCIFDFNQNQIGVLKTLIKALHAGHLGEVAKCVIHTFHAFYFPTSSDRSAFNVFAEPLNAFLALLCLHENGTPRTLGDSSHYSARLQFAIRLRGFHHLFLHATSWLKLCPSVSDGVIRGKSVVRAPHRSAPVTGRRNHRRVAMKKCTTEASENYLSSTSDSDLEPLKSKKSKHLKGVWLESHPSIPTMELDPILQQSNQSNWWRDFAIPFCSQYLTAYQLTPFAFVRETIRVLSYAISKKRKTATTFWKDDSTVIIGPQTIDLSIFRSFLSSQIERLEEFFRTEILFGKRLDELGITVDFSKIIDDGDMKTLMRSPLLESIHGNHDSNILLNFMLEDKSVVEINPGDNKMRWHAARAEKWLGNIHYGTSRVQAAAHITQGAPGRISEEAKSQLANTEVGRRHLVILQSLNTLALWSNYSKTTKVTGAFKEVLRVYPHRIARLIFILIRLVRPIEILYLIKHRYAQVTEELEFVMTVYKSKLWASFGMPFTADNMRENLADFLMSEDGENPPPFPFHFGVRMYREFATAVQRRHIQIPVKYSRAVAQQGTQVGDLQAGRSTETSLQNYAVEKSVIDMEPGFTEHYISYSCAWQRFWGLDLEGKNDVQYSV